jgi:hypothetical protein
VKHLLIYITLLATKEHNPSFAAGFEPSQFILDVVDTIYISSFSGFVLDLAI